MALDPASQADSKQSILTQLDPTAWIALWTGAHRIMGLVRDWLPGQIYQMRREFDSSGQVQELLISSKACLEP